MAKELGVEAVERALRRSRGILTDAARSLGCSRTTLYNYIAKYPKLGEIAVQARSELADLAEKGLWRLVKDRDGPTIRWTLKNLRSEIYSDRFDTRVEGEVVLAQTEPIHVQVEHLNADGKRLSDILRIMGEAGLVPVASNGSGARANGHA